MKIIVLLIILLGCKNPIIGDKQSVTAPPDTVTAPIGNPPDFPSDVE